MIPPPVPPVPAWMSWAGAWGRPPDRPAQVALGIAALLLVAAVAPNGPHRVASFLEAWGVADVTRRRRFIFVTGFVAAFLSLGYMAFYLRGGPRAPEAAAYWLEGRALSHGWFAWVAPDPTADFRTLLIPFGPPSRLAAPFAPAFPLLLSLGFLLGAPMIVGPLVAAALVAGTWLLGRELAAAAGEPPDRAEALARTAAGLSVLSAAMRFQTGEALPHGAAALAVAVALSCALRARRTCDARWYAAAGGAVGAACAAAPWSSVAIGAVVLGMAGLSTRPARAASYAVLGSLPGVLFLLAAHRAASGHAFAAARMAMHGAMAMTGPVSAHPARAALAAFARQSLRGARLHLADVANFEPLALAPLALALRKARTRAALVPAIVVLGAAAVHAAQVLSHAPLAVEGVARWARSGILAEVLPVEHVLIALALARTFPIDVGRSALVVFGLAFAGFALHVSYDHEQLATSGVGRPRFEPDVPRDAGVTHGLLFFEDDDGYELAADPNASASHGIEAARMRGDDHDRLLYDILGHPPAHRYLASRTGLPTLPPFAPPGGETWRFEAEVDALLPTTSFVDAPGCGTDVHAVSVDPEGTTTLELPVPRGATPAARRTWLISPRVFDRGAGGNGSLDLVTSLGGAPVAHWAWTESAKSSRCFDLAAQPVELGGERDHAWWVLTAHGGPVALDRTVLRPR